MEINGFNCDDYRYFSLEKVPAWSGCVSTTYGTLKKNDIIKIANKDLTQYLLNSNYKKRLSMNCLAYHPQQYPTEMPFSLEKYLAMQPPIVFKYSGNVLLHYEQGAYFVCNSWLKRKMFLDLPSTRLFANRRQGSMKEENMHILSLAEQEKVQDSPVCLDSAETLKEVRNSYPELYKFKMDTAIEVHFLQGDAWYLQNPSVAMALLNQNFMHLLANSKEILNEEKERLFQAEYQDNIPNKKRRYYQVKPGIQLHQISQLVDPHSLDDFGVSFSSFVVRMNGARVDACPWNLNNFDLNRNIKYFYIDYFDSLSDRIVEKEILKIAIRLPLEEALQVEEQNEKTSVKHQEFEDALSYIQKNKKKYHTYCVRTKEKDPVQFVKEEKKELGTRLVKTLQKRVQTESFKKENF